MRELSIQLLGAFRLHDSRGQEIKIASRKGRALLAYLATHAGESQSRDRLASLLWEEADEELARTSLRQALASLRKVLPTPAQAALRTDTESVALDATIIECDLGELRNALSGATGTSLRKVLEHYRGELLDGVDARSAAFDDWLSHERLVLRRQVTESLQQLAALCTANDDTEGALAACTRLVSLEPLNEAAHRTIMDLHARRNAYAEALRQYRICRDALRRELDVSPEPATEALYRDLMRRRRAGSGSAEETDDDVVVVAPAIATPVVSSEPRPGLRDAVVSVARLEGLLELEAVADPEEAHAIALRFHSLVQEAVHSCGGVTDRRVGANVLAVFGVPMAHGNEVERASRAALALRRAFAEQRWSTQIELKLRIGIAQGQILPSPDLFPLTGKPTHVAHSLAARASDNQILLADEVRHSLGDRFETNRTAVPANAAADVTSAWALHSARADAHTTERPFVGRRPELAMILAVLDRCTTSKHGRAIVVRGEAGIGKTKLVDAIRDAAVERGTAVHHAQVFDFGQSPGRRPITTLALSLCGVADDASPAERSDAVHRLTHSLRVGIDQTVFLSDLIDAPLSSELEALEQAMDAATRQRGRTLALTQLIELAARESPLLLIVEDVHWADTDELARLGEVAAVVANCPILLVMTTRPEGDPISATWRARARGCPVTTVDLAPLADDEAHELAAHYRELPPAMIEACIRRAEGYPLFLDQLLRAASSGHDALPGSVRTLVIARVDRLCARDQDALQAAAILGHRLGNDALQSLIDDPGYDPLGLLDAGLMRADGFDLQFTHALFRDAIYESTLRSRRKELHLRAAEWFRTRDVALHADHLAAADHEGAAAAYSDAARSEQNALRFERAFALASKANALAREPVLLHQTSCLLGELQLQLGRTHDALTAYREALDFALDQPGHGAAQLGIASALRIMDRYEEALDALDSAEQALGDGMPAQMKARIYTLRGNLCFPLGRLDACLQAHQHAQRFAEAAGTPVELARAHGGLGDAWYQRGRIVTAHKHFERCIEEARRHGLAGVLLANLPMLCVTHHFCGNIEASTRTYQEALELVRRVGDRRGELLVHLVAASTLMMQAKLEECRSHAKLAVEFAQRVGARRFQAECTGMLAVVSLAEGDKTTAMRLITDAVAIARDTGMSYCGPVLLSVMARATDDPVQRAAVLREGENLLADGCVSHSYFEFYWNATAVSLETKAWSDARRYANELAAYTHEEPVPWSELVIERARLLADIGEGVGGANAKSALETLAAKIRACGGFALMPRIDAALQSL
ncbi:MAG TPA: AAA family ATPase [Steroidobacteraceae bacterium]|nr:AAA family ATPase [Steroidobacteraceae bacterium]